MTVKLEPSWKATLEKEFDKEYFKELTEFVRNEYKKKKVYPPPSAIFHALEMCAFDKVKVVILGQDPYHGAGQANGMAFSVNDGVTIPPSLMNIYKEIHEDLGKPIPTSGNLDRWAAQGVLLLNATLTVIAGQAGSHQKKGWEQFTDVVIQALSDQREHLVFMLWGRYAQEKGKVIDTNKHFVLTTTHPSPFSAYSGFMGSRHFSKANAYLKEHGQAEIDW
ncbi:uracil-DNA glycosylase [Candidatus Gracilibacteria bacterium]|nr:uracil-DNA glycosylase [Candidatus Gracilibacteria bacterium]